MMNKNNAKIEMLQDKLLEAIQAKSVLAIRKIRKELEQERKKNVTKSFKSE